MDKESGRLTGSRPTDGTSLPPTGFDPGRVAELRAAFMAGWLTKGASVAQPSQAFDVYLKTLGRTL
jgi:hypothetical protein